MAIHDGVFRITVRFGAHLGSGAREVVRSTGGCQASAAARDYHTMPNVRLNRIAISGPPSVVMDLVRTLAGDEEPFDFEELIPMPDAFLGAAGEEVTPTGLPRWYLWALTNWDVNWNAYGGSRRGYGRPCRVRYRFCAAYRPPSEFLDRVAFRWLEVTMRLLFEVEFVGAGDGLWTGGARVALQDEVV